MRMLKNQNDKPWLCSGDFNEILHSWEKEGGVPRQQIHMDRFKQALEFCELDDLGFAGDAFTWRNNNHDPAKYIRERLDRAVASVSSRQRFPAYKVTNGDPRHSDHRPIIIETDGAERVRRGSSKGLTPRFEAQWFEEENCKEIIRNAWELQVNQRNQLVEGAVKEVLGELVSWSKNILEDLEK
jgi:hypothetical protein